MHRYKILLSTLLLFVIVVTTYLLSCPEWFFDGEDYGLVFRACQCTSLKDLLDFFINGNVCSLSSFSLIQNLQPQDYTQTATYYRPLLLALHTLQFHAFGLEAYAYFVFIITVHALSAATIMYLIMLITNDIVLSFFCSLFFAFHQFLYGWLGKIDMQQHQMTLFLVLAAFLVWIKSRQKPQLRTYGLACILLLSSLLIRETFLILPLIIMLALGIFRSHNSSSMAKRYRRLLAVCIIITLLYITLRTMACPQKAFPLPNPTTIINADILKSVYKLLLKFTQFLYDFFWCQWFPWSTYDFFYCHNMLTLYRTIKAIILLTVAALFITNIQKKIIIFALLSTLTLLWPLLFTSYGGYRFTYETLPFCTLALACLIHFSPLTENNLVRNLIYGILVVSISINGVHVIKSMRNIMKIPHRITTTLRNFRNINGTKYQQAPLFVFNAPSPLVATGLVQAIRLYGIGLARPIYFFAGLTITTNLDAQSACALIDIVKTKAGLRFLSRNHELVIFSLRPEEELFAEQKHFYIDHTIIHHQVSDKISDIEFTFKPGYYRPDIQVLALFLDETCLVDLNSLHNGLRHHPAYH
jgi:hypothetical protein